MNSCRHRAASCGSVCTLWRQNWDSWGGREPFGTYPAGGWGGEGHQLLGQGQELAAPDPTWSGNDLDLAICSGRELMWKVSTTTNLVLNAKLGNYLKSILSLLPV